MEVQPATPQDIPAWLTLAAEVESLFGSLVADASFNNALRKNIQRGSAFCVREGNGPPGVPLMGAMLWSAHPPRYEIGWFAVALGWHRHGVGRALVEHALSFAHPPAEIAVTTFGEDVPGGEPARGFYRAMGFEPAEPAQPGHGADSRQILRRYLP